MFGVFTSAPNRPAPTKIDAHFAFGSVWGAHNSQFNRLISPTMARLTFVNSDFSDLLRLFNNNVKPVRVDVLMGIPGLRFAEAWERQNEVDFDQ